MPAYFFDSRARTRFAISNPSCNQRNENHRSNCTSAELKIDGENLKDVKLRGVARLLAMQANSMIELELINRFDSVAEPVRQLYRLQFRIPEKRALDEVDRAFVEYLGTPDPTMGRVARFLEDARCKGCIGHIRSSSLGKRWRQEYRSYIAPRRSARLLWKRASPSKRNSKIAAIYHLRINAFRC
jgi:hypothetical protein